MKVKAVIIWLEEREGSHYIVVELEGDERIVEIADTPIDFTTLRINLGDEELN